MPHRVDRENQLVGRADELQLARAGVDAAFSGNGALILISGSPGIGKTALAREIAADARERGGTVLWGRGYDGGWSPPYTPWLEALASVPSSEAESALSPMLEARDDTTDPAAAQFAFHEAIAQRLHTRAEMSPIVVILDDMHWADPGSVELLRHISHFSLRGGLCIVATLRDLSPASGEPLADALRRLQQRDTTTSIHLGGLTSADVAKLVASTAHAQISVDDADTIARVSAGNPLYVTSLAQNRRLLLRESNTGDRAAVHVPGPDSYKEIARARLARLSEAARLTVSRAAVFTAGFDFNVLPALTDLAEEALLDVIDELIDAGLIEPMGERGQERYDFSHALIREALINHLSPSRRIRLERQAAEAMERSFKETLDDRSPELAIQYGRSASLAGADRGLPFAQMAAERARRGFDRQQVVFFLRIARDLSATCNPTIRARILTELAVAESDAVLVEHAEATSTEAIHLLTRSGAQPEEIAAFYADFVTSLKQHASAAAGVWRPLLDAGLAVPGLQRERAWARLMLLLDPVEPVPGARIRSGRWIGFDPEAVAIARSTGDERSLARSVESFDYRSRQGTEELLSNVRGWHDPEAVMYGMTVVANDYQYRHGQFRAAGDLWNELSALAERNGALNWQAQAMNQLTLLHVATGRFEHARASEAQANALLDRLGAGRRSDVLEREMTTALAMEFGGDWSTLGWEWKAVAEDAALGPRDPATLMTSLNAAVSAYCFAEAGDREAARSMLTALTPVLEALTPTDANQNGAVAFAADTVWKIEATEFAHRYERLALDLQEYGIGDYPQSSIERAIAQMLALQGRFEEAIVAIKAARETAEATGQLPQHARTFLDEARIRSQANDPTPIKELLRQATERFTQLGMGEWSARATAGMHEFESKVAARGNSAGDLTDREIEVLRYVIRGYSDQHISEILFISPRTVHTHIRNMLSKTAAINRTELSVWAVARGIADGKQSS